MFCWEAYAVVLGGGRSCSSAILFWGWSLVGGAGFVKKAICVEEGGKLC